MKNFLNIINKTRLFQGIADDNTQQMLKCLDAKFSDYNKGNTIFLAGNPAKWIGLVLDGEVEVVRDDVFGNRTILTKLSPGELFGETFACASVDTLPVSVLASTDCKILLLDYRKVAATCTSSCVFHGQLIKNMMYILAKKNLMLNSKTEILSARTTREKLLSFLNAQSMQTKSRKFSIQFNRQELADYLSVDRSALSREMSTMQKDGLIRFSSNQFELL